MSIEEQERKRRYEIRRNIVNSIAEMNRKGLIGSTHVNSIDDNRTIQIEFTPIVVVPKVTINISLEEIENKETKLRNHIPEYGC